LRLEDDETDLPEDGDARCASIWNTFDLDSIDIGVCMSQDHHSDGQKDFTQGKYDPPHSVTPLDYIIHSDHTLKKMEEDNNKYDAGYSNARDQK
jgi:hypothetical protein